MTRMPARDQFYFFLLTVRTNLCLLKSSSVVDCPRLEKFNLSGSLQTSTNLLKALCSPTLYLFDLSLIMQEDQETATFT